MDEDAAFYGSRPRPMPHCTRWGPSSRESGTATPCFRLMSIVATVAHLSYCWALVSLTMHQKRLAAGFPRQSRMLTGNQGRSWALWSKDPNPHSYKQSNLWDNRTSSWLSLTFPVILRRAYAKKDIFKSTFQLLRMYECYFSSTKPLVLHCLKSKAIAMLRYDTMEYINMCLKADE